MKRREAAPVPRPRRARLRSPPRPDYANPFAEEFHRGDRDEPNPPPNVKPTSRIALLVCFVLGYLIGARLWLILIALAAVAAWVISNRNTSFFLWHAWNQLRAQRR